MYLSLAGRLRGAGGAVLHDGLNYGRRCGHRHHLCLMLTNVVILALGIAAIFGMRAALLRAFTTTRSGADRAPSSWRDDVLLLSVLYFQYHFRRIAEWKTTGAEVAPLRRRAYFTKISRSSASAFGSWACTCCRPTAIGLTLADAVPEGARSGSARRRPDQRRLGGCRQRVIDQLAPCSACGAPATSAPPCRNHQRAGLGRCPGRGDGLDRLCRRPWPRRHRRCRSVPRPAGCWPPGRARRTSTAPRALSAVKVGAAGGAVPLPGGGGAEHLGWHSPDSALASARVEQVVQPARVVLARACRC